MEKADIRNLTMEDMEKMAVSIGQKAFRGRQLYQWVNKGITDFREMKNLPEVFIRLLMSSFRGDSLQVLRREVSALDGTQKFLFGLSDGNAVESVFMKYHYGNSVCISSQAGCRMGCAFCASGINGLVRNLTAGEMLSQVIDVSAELKKPVNHIVIMGTGEPFDNYPEVSRFLHMVHQKEGLNMGARNITVSTCGILPGIWKFSEEFPQVNLAVSLHSPTHAQREKLMPVERAYPLSELMETCKTYTKRTKRRITFEYALIRGFNDRDQDAEQLSRLVKGMLCHINLIPLNQVDESGLLTSGRKRAEDFARILQKENIPATVRRQLGADINGACGQLRLKMDEAF